MDSEEEVDVGGGEENQKTPKARKSKTKTSPKDQTTPIAKKPRKEKNALPKLPKIKARRGRKPKDTEEVYDADQVAKDTKILADNPLFSELPLFISNCFVAYNSMSDAIMNPSSALQSSAEDFLESFQQSPEAALAELINLVLRACGCNDSVDPDQVVDFDGIVSTLDDFTEVLKQVCHCFTYSTEAPNYETTGKLPCLPSHLEIAILQTVQKIIIRVDRASYCFCFCTRSALFVSAHGNPSTMGCVYVFIPDTKFQTHSDCSCSGGRECVV